MTLLERVKIANRITTTAYDAEFAELIDEAKADLKLKGITQAEVESDPNIRKAIVLYCSIHHGQRDDREMLQRSYDDLRAKLGMSTGYTTWASKDQPEPEDSESGGDGSQGEAEPGTGEQNPGEVTQPAAGGNETGGGGE